MEWFNYLAAFFAGVFLANAVPHFVHGISGDKFPTPFAKPPGKGLSPAPVNMVWALFNLVIGYLLLRPGMIFTGAPLPMILMFLGIIVISIMLSVHFQKKDRPS